MTDKERFLNEIKEVKLIIQANRAQGAFSEGYLIGQESVLEHFEKFIDSMQEEPVSKQKLSNVERIGKNWKEEPVSESLEKASTKYAQDKYMPVQTSQAFKAGAKWQFERAKEALLSEVLPCFMHGGEADEVVAKLDEVLNFQKK